MGKAAQKQGKLPLPHGLEHNEFSRRHSRRVLQRNAWIWGRWRDNKYCMCTYIPVMGAQLGPARCAPSRRADQWWQQCPSIVHVEQRALPPAPGQQNWKGRTITCCKRRPEVLEPQGSNSLTPALLNAAEIGTCLGSACPASGRCLDVGLKRPQLPAGQPRCALPAGQPLCFWFSTLPEDKCRCLGVICVLSSAASGPY